MSPHGMGETASTYAAAHQLFSDRLSEVAALFIRNPHVQATSVEIHHGRIEIVAEGVAGVFRDWCRAVPEHKRSTALVTTSYGLDEADVLEGEHIRVTVRRPLGLAGGVS